MGVMKDLEGAAKGVGTAVGDVARAAGSAAVAVGKGAYGALSGAVEGAERAVEGNKSRGFEDKLHPAPNHAAGYDHSNTKVHVRGQENQSSAARPANHGVDPNLATNANGSQMAYNWGNTKVKTVPGPSAAQIATIVANEGKK